jgi:hypothetical protein
MKKISFLSAVVICGALLGSPVGAAPQAKTYQVTGPVLEITDSFITVENRAGEKWQIARDAGTKITGDLKVGAKVTIQYRMIATTVEVKGDKAEPTEKPAAPEKAKKAEKK